MKIIFSRKGFDTWSGGVPSPIFPDGKMLSLPIPDKNSPIQYKDLYWYQHNLGNLVSNLTNKKILPQYGAHLDPDLDAKALRRSKGWKPVFGQVGAAQGHLRKQLVGPGDIFIYFGLFREVITTTSGFRYLNETSPKHIIWGWLQIDEVISVDHSDRKKFMWALYHPHFHRSPDKSNTLYVSKKYLEIDGIKKQSIKGAGVFDKFSQKLQLTKSDSKNVSNWEFPSWFYPSDNKPALSYHSDIKRWRKNNESVLLSTVGRGQEFVLENSHYPEVEKWLCNLLET